MYSNKNTGFIPVPTGWVNSFLYVSQEEFLALAGTPGVEILYIRYREHPKALLEIRYPWGLVLPLHRSGNSYTQVVK